MLMPWTQLTRCGDDAGSGSGASSSFKANGSETKVNAYMMFLLYAVAVLALIKAVGASMYMVSRICHTLGIRK